MTQETTTKDRRDECSSSTRKPLWLDLARESERQTARTGPSPANTQRDQTAAVVVVGPHRCAAAPPSNRSQMLESTPCMVPRYRYRRGIFGIRPARRNCLVPSDNTANPRYVAPPVIY
ncbi:hypothetical protein QAD02_017524 [Eretmocerus hayati]|uniref:Uncharacterized protein n=1 Tax=Eretmocerus hayati TaxID=131215 RepID=A0ACC2PH34_9HYME|nr:hypothetical protein QAD02_017524 [Eretmocerus hayati]